jgi:hypothetical protein
MGVETFIDIEFIELNIVEVASIADEFSSKRCFFLLPVRNCCGLHVVFVIAILHSQM